jgi:hypothetical protein
MPSIAELKVEQKRRLYQFLTLKKDLADTNVPRLDEYIKAAIVEMEKEDVAWVREQVEME